MNQHKGEDEAPKWLNKDQSACWTTLLDWRLAFRREKSEIRKAFLFYALRSSGVATGISLIIAALLWKTIGTLWFTSSTLTSIANICCVTAASVTAIILAFVLFLFGRADELEAQARNSINHEIHNLESVRERAGDFAHVEVEQSTIDAPLKARIEHLKDTAKKFDTAIFELIYLFSRAARGTSYDSARLALLGEHISARGGDWHTAYRRLFPDFSGRAFAVKVWNDATSASRNLWKLNSDIELAEEQHHKALQVSLALPSLSMVAVLALIAILVANTLATREGISEVFAILLCVTLILLLSTQVFLLVRWVCQLVYREMIVRAANREADRKYAERHTKVDTKEMLEDAVSLYAKKHANHSEAKTEAREQENDRPSGETRSNS